MTAVLSALQRFEGATGDPLPLFVGLVDALRPSDPADAAQARARFGELLTALRASAAARHAVRDALLRLLATRRLTRFFSDAGILPNTGFFSELARRIQHRLLPEAPDPASMRDAVREIYRGRHDHAWLEALDAQEAHAFWALLDLRGAPDAAPLHKAARELLDAAQILSHRVSALGLEPELLRVLPGLDAHESPFLAQAAEVHRTLDALRAWVDTGMAGEPPPQDDRHLHVLLEQCREVVQRARRVAAARGTSLRLTYLLVRLQQSLARLDTLLRLLGARTDAQPERAALAGWVAFHRAAVRGENERNSVRLHWARMVSLLALRVTDNASRTGEHYITTDRAGFLLMWRSAMGAGLIIAVMALLKIYASKLGLAPLNQALVYSLNYGLGFMLIQVLHFTVATKQPAMTAAAIAAVVSETQPKADLGRLASLVIDVLRSQFAAILGNVLVAFPVAAAIAFGLSAAAGRPFIDEAKALHLLDELHPFASLAIPHAAIAGVCLFLSGLITGYFDNHASYARVPDRVARLPWLVRRVGAARARRFADWLGDNLGGLAGNFLFGCMLGTLGTLGMLVGLPVDIRHIAFASANLAYAWVALHGALPLAAFAWGLLGVVLIGITNLAVSFSLALWVAMRSRGVTFQRSGELVRLLMQRVREAPMRLFVPPPATPDRAPG